jgi:hypothetical protein
MADIDVSSLMGDGEEGTETKKQKKQKAQVEAKAQVHKLREEIPKSIMGDKKLSRAIAVKSAVEYLTGCAKANILDMNKENVLKLAQYWSKWIEE